MLACRVGDRDGGEQPSGGTERSRDEHRGPESRDEGVRVQVGGAGDAGQGGHYGDGQQAAEPGHVVVDRRRDARMIGGRRAHGGGGERRDRDRDPEPEHDHRRQDVRT
jgi:hypothetical protein